MKTLRAFFESVRQSVEGFVCKDTHANLGLLMEAAKGSHEVNKHRIDEAQTSMLSLCHAAEAMHGRICELQFYSQAQAKQIEVLRQVVIALVAGMDAVMGNPLAPEEIAFLDNLGLPYKVQTATSEKI